MKKDARQKRGGDTILRAEGAKEERNSFTGEPSASGATEGKPLELGGYGSSYRYRSEAEREQGRKPLTFPCCHSLPSCWCLPLTEPKRNPESAEGGRSSQISDNVNAKPIGFADWMWGVKERKAPG